MSVNFNPALWGPSMWFVLHTAALKYPATPTEADKRNMGRFVTSLRFVLPCDGCCRGFETVLRRTAFGDKDLASSDALFAWTVRAHGMVNQKLGKPARDDPRRWKQKYLNLVARQ